MNVNIAAMQENTNINPLITKNGLENQNVKVSHTEKSKETDYNNKGVKSTSVEKSAGIYRGEKVSEDEVNKRILEIKAKLDELVNHMTGKDYEDFKKEGHKIDAYDVEKIVTVIDQIKVKLAAYCDNYENPINDEDMEMVESIMGSTGVAQSVASKMNQYDIPVTEENVKDVKSAVDMAHEITQVEKEQAAYIAENQIEPSIENVYKAQHSSNSADAKEQLKLKEEEWNQLKEQAASILEKQNIEVTEENMETARWMLEQGLPLDGITVKTFYSLLSVNTQENWSAEEAVENIVQAMAKGKEAKETLVTGENYRPQTVEEALQELEDRVNKIYDVSDSSIEAIKARRQLEEIRLMMTKEAGMNLLKKGIDIQTEPLENLVEELKIQEQEYYQKLYETDGLEMTADKANMVKETTNTIEALKAVPAYVVGEMAESQAVSAVTAGKTYETGTVLKNQLDTAGESYEALMTKPDREYGDNINKAFRNIDEILTDMNLQVNEENRRAVKILAYNQMELTEENIESIKELDAEYQYLLKNLTPRVTMYMIENHINPLQTEIYELNDKIEEIKKEIGEDKEEKYSEFLWKLEQKQELSQEDRDAYIGLYRLFNTVNRTQGAAIGALANQNTDVTLENLLTAARSRKAKGMDVSVTEDFGLSEVTWKEKNITQQLKGFLDTFENPNEAYAQEKKRQIKELSGEKEAMRMLTESEQPVTINHLMAAGFITSKAGNMWKDLYGEGEQKQKADKFLEAMEEKESMEEPYETLESEAKKQLEDILYQPEITHEKLEDVRLFYNTAQFITKLAKQEDYYLPMEINGELTDVHLKIVHKQEEAGKVEIQMDVKELGEIRAEFKVTNGKVKGFLLCSSVEGIEKIRQTEELFYDALQEQGLEMDQMVYSRSSKIPKVTDEIENTEQENKIETKTLYQVAKIFLVTTKNI